MAVTRAARCGLAPWAGLVAAMAGAGLQHQGIGDALHFNCGFGAAAANLALGLLALALIAAGGWVSWRALRRAPDAPDATARFVAHLSLMAVALFALMVLWQTLAGLLVPACPG